MLVGLVCTRLVVAVNFEDFDVVRKRCALHDCVREHFAGELFLREVGIAHVGSDPAYAEHTDGVDVFFDGLKDGGYRALCIYVGSELGAVEKGVAHVRDEA